ncbi:MAG: glycosyltransferase family 4 protein [bacterium]
MTKIAMLSDCALQNTGYATITRNLLNELTNRGFECINFAHSYVGQQISNVKFSDGTVCNFTIHGNGMQQYFQDILEPKLREFKPDILIILLDTFMTYPWLLQKDLSPAKTIFYFPHDGGGTLPLGCDQILRKVDKAVAMAQNGQEICKCKYNIDAHYIPHAVHHNIYKPYSEDKKKQLRQAYGFSENDFIIGSVARNQSRKMMDRTFKIFKEFAKINPLAKLFLHTDPYDNAAIFNMMEMIKEYKIQNRVRFSGMKYYKGFDYTKMPDVYNLMDVFILTTSGEGFGVPIIEAMSCEIPCLVTNYTTTEELVLKTGSGMGINLLTELTGTWNVERGICSIEDGVQKLNLMFEHKCKNTVQWRMWKSNGRKAVIKNYTWDKVTNDWIKLFEEILEEDLSMKDEVYFKDRQLEVKHFIDAKNWKEFFNCKTAFEFGCGLGPRVYAMNFVGINARGSEKSLYAVNHSMIKDKVVQEDILNTEYDAIEDAELVILYDILEHIPYNKLNDAINIAINRTSKYILVSIPYKETFNCDNDPTHIIKEDREWWVKQFLDKGLKEIKVPDNFLFKEQLLIFEVQYEN